MDELEQMLKNTFLDEAEQLLEETEQCFLQLEKRDVGPEVIEQIFRLAHNLKGSAGAVGFEDVALFTHHLESMILGVRQQRIAITPVVVNLLLRSNDHLKLMAQGLRTDLEAHFSQDDILREIAAIVADKAAADELGDGGDATGSAFLGGDNEGGGDLVSQAQVASGGSEEESTPVQQVWTTSDTSSDATPSNRKSTPARDDQIRVSLSRLDRLMNDVGELVILQTVLQQHRHVIASDLIQRTIAQLTKITKDIQDNSMSLRMVPLKQTFMKMQRIVRDTSHSLGKSIDLEVTGEETELDKTVLDHISDPLVHMVRNAVDHGIETAEERVAAGKPASGRIKLRAYHRSGQIVLEVVDDGQGLDAEKLTAKAIDKGLIAKGSVLTETAAHHLIFLAGFSTKEQVTDLSGRGVGMDVVKTNFERLSGRVEIESVKGKGTTLRAVLPLTLAIIDGMVVQVDRDLYVVPLASVHESVRPSGAEIATVAARDEVVSIRGEWVPLHRLGRLLGRKQTDTVNDSAIAIVIRRERETPFAVLVDDIIGRQQVVIKRLGEEVRNVAGVSGAAVLGDGKAALILDLPELVGRSRPSKKNANNARQEAV